MAYIPIIKTARIDNDAVTSAKILDGTITDADVAAANIDGTAGTPSLRTLGTGATQALAGNTTLDAIANPVADLDMDGFKITDLGSPVAASDAATKGYVDSVAAGLDTKAAVSYTTTGNITLSGLGTQANGTWPATMTAGTRVLVKDQTTLADNGIYEASSSGWTRAADFDGSPANEVTNGAYTLVAADDGTSLIGTGWVVISPDPITVGTDDLVWTGFSMPGVVANLDDLLDVNTTGVVADSILRFDGTDWVDTANIFVDDANTMIQFDTAGASGAIQGVGTVLEITGGTRVDVNTDVQLEGLVDMQAGQRVDVQSLSADHTVVLATDYLLIMNSSAALRTVTLPATHVAGSTIVVKRVGANNVEIATADADTIDGSGSNYVMDVDLMAINIVSDGTNWVVV